MAWRLANALVALRNGVNAKWPNRDKRSDGTIGDAAHASRHSDHNPWIVVGGVGVVRAFDCDVDGINAAWYAEQLRLAGAAGDSRLAGGGYVIYNRRITSPDFRSWRVYTGSNPHTMHVHVSFSRNQAGFDRTDGWAFLGGGGGGGGGGTDPTPTLRKGSRGAAVTKVQNRLKVHGFDPGAADGIFGDKTDQQVRRFQGARRLTVDGIVGDNTWRALNAAPPAPPRPPSGRATIRRGSKGQLVKDLQGTLNRWYPRLSKLAVDGDFGPATEARVKYFQGRARLAVDGIVGPNTWRALGY